MWSGSPSNMAYGNQWMNMNPALYKNMTNEQGMQMTVNCLINIILEIFDYF